MEWAKWVGKPRGPAWQWHSARTASRIAESQQYEAKGRRGCTEQSRDKKRTSEKAELFICTGDNITGTNGHTNQRLMCVCVCVSNVCARRSSHRQKWQKLFNSLFALLKAKLYWKHNIDTKHPIFMNILCGFCCLDGQWQKNQNMCNVWSFFGRVGGWTICT